MTTDEAAATERLQYQVQLIESIIDRADNTATDLVIQGSQLSDDDTLLGAHPTSHLVGHCLAVSQDALNTARLILQDQSTGGLRVPFIGLYPVLRTSIESASLAIWILAPESREERLKRSLMARMDDIHHDDHLALVLTGPLAEDSKAEIALKQKQRRANSVHVRAQKRRIRGYATEAGIDLDEINGGLPGFGPILYDTSGAIGVTGNQAQGIWSFVSGLTHPSVKRSVTASDIEKLADRTPDGFFAASFTANLRTVAMALDAAVGAHLAALRLLALRGGRPELEWSPPQDFPLPPTFRGGTRAS